MPDKKRDTVFRSAPGFELRAATDTDAGGMPTMVVNFARFDEWTEIRSLFEGHFLERFVEGAFAKTIREQFANIRSLLQHGRDPSVGMKPLGRITDLREQADGAYADVQLLDAPYVRELVPGLKEGLFGASFQFRPVRQEIVEKPVRSDHNPDGLPEITVTEAMVHEVGPVTFGAYPNASSSIRSLTDDMIFEQMLREQPDRLRELLTEKSSSDQTPDPDGSTSTEERAPDTVVSTPALEIARRRLLLMQRRYVGTPGI